MDIKVASLERYPHDRWGQLFTALPLLAASYSVDCGFPRTAIYRTRFFAGYLVAFPSDLEAVDSIFASLIRRGLFESLLGVNDGNTFFHQIRKYLTAGDEQACRGRGFGTLDGGRFFDAVEQAQPPYTEAIFIGLKAALELRMIDLSIIV